MLWTIPNILERPSKIHPRSQLFSKTKILTANKSEMLIKELFWTNLEFTGTTSERRIYSQNLDFYIFPLLVEHVYADLETLNPKLRKEMPFCILMHVCTKVLNAAIIDMVKTINYEDWFTDEESLLNLIPDDYCIPAQIA